MRSALVLACLAACGSASSAPDPYAAHLVELRHRLAKSGMRKVQIRIEEPFVVIGNGTAEDLARDAETVRWAVRMLEQDFFAKRPTHIIDIFLFRDDETYRRGVKRLTLSEPTTPFGFYSREHGAMFMNIATGGGTLVHEIVHPYVEADFPDAPPWLNEGLGSLFEQSGEKSGHIVGLTNWRLRGLKQAIDSKDVPVFANLMRKTAAEFYGDDKGINYATARYLLFYVQNEGKLVDFYRAFRAGHVQDPTGIATLGTVLDEPDMLDFQQRWQAVTYFLDYP